MTTRRAAEQGHAFVRSERPVRDRDFSPAARSAGSPHGGRALGKEARGQIGHRPVWLPTTRSPVPMVPLDGRWHLPTGWCRLQADDGEGRQWMRRCAQRHSTASRCRQPRCSWCGVLRRAETAAGVSPEAQRRGLTCRVARGDCGGVRSSEEPLVPAPLLSSQPVVEPKGCPEAPNGWDGTEIGAWPRKDSWEPSLDLRCPQRGRSTAEPYWRLEVSSAPRCPSSIQIQQTWPVMLNIEGKCLMGRAKSPPLH